MAESDKICPRCNKPFAAHHIDEKGWMVSPNGTKCFRVRNT